MNSKENERLVITAIESYKIPFSKLKICKEKLSSEAKHEDKHYKIEIDGTPFSLRLLSTSRYGNGPLAISTIDTLNNQLRYTDYLRKQEVPFMERVKRKTLSEDDDLYTSIRDDDGKEWMCCIFGWIEGRHITKNTDKIAFEVGKMARKIHDIPIVDKNDLKTVNHSDAYHGWLNELRDLRFKLSDEKVEKAFSDYLDIVQSNLETLSRLKSDDDQKIIATDLNSLNILWGEYDEIVGVVDHEHIGFSDRCQELAWLIKWYSRQEGLQSHKVSPALTKQLLEGYGAGDILNEKEKKRLYCLLWLSGCFNLNFVLKTKKYLMDNSENCNYDQLKTHLETYLKRGKGLVSLLQKNYEFD